MAPTIIPGDIFWASEPPMVGGLPEVKVGDIIVYNHRERNGAVTSFVKRVVALENQRVAFVDGVPRLDGLRATVADMGVSDVAFQDYAPGYSKRLRRQRETLSGRTYETYFDAELREDMVPMNLRNVPERLIQSGHIFAVGDFRDNSNDSRSEGPVPLRDVTFIADRVVFSVDLSRVGRSLR
jgi:signal peptidase I